MATNFWHDLEKLIFVEKNQSLARYCVRREMEEQSEERERRETGGWKGRIVGDPRTRWPVT